MSIVRYDSKISRIRRLIRKKDYLDSVVKSANLLVEVLRDKYCDTLKLVSPEKRLEIEKIKNEKAKGQRDEKIGLGQWIGIYSKSGLFKRIGTKTFTPENLNKTNNLRNVAVHKEYKLKHDEVFLTYVTLINILIELGYDVSPGSHKLCQICFKEWATRKGVCELCYRGTKILIDLMKEMKDKIDKRIHEIRTIFHPKLAESYKEYMPEGFKVLPKRPLRGIFRFREDSICPSPETKKEKRGRERQEKRYRRTESAWKEHKKAAMQKVYKEKRHVDILRRTFQWAKVVTRDSNVREEYEEIFRERFMERAFPRLKDVGKLDKKELFDKFYRDELAGELELINLLPELRPFLVRPKIDYRDVSRKEIDEFIEFKLRNVFLEDLQKNYTMLLAMGTMFEVMLSILDDLLDYSRYLSKWSAPHISYNKLS